MADSVCTNLFDHIYDNVERSLFIFYSVDCNVKRTTDLSFHYCVFLVNITNNGKTRGYPKMSFCPFLS